MHEQYLEMAYARVSTKAQELDRQEQSIKEAVPNLSLRYFFEDKKTGKNFDREQYSLMKEKINELLEVNPDLKIRITIHELDRLGRNYAEIQKEIFWFRSKGVKLRFLDIPEQLCSDALGVTGDLVVDILIMVNSWRAEQELKVKEKRTEEGRKAAHDRGVIFGRKAIVIDEKKFKDIASKAYRREISHSDAMKCLGYTPYLYWKHFNRLFPQYEGRHFVGGTNNE